MAPVPVAKTQWGPVHSASFPEVWDKPVFSSGLGVLREALGGTPKALDRKGHPQEPRDWVVPQDRSWLDFFL